MSWTVLYLLLLKATVTSFSGLTSLPVVHHDLVVRRHVISERQLNAAVVAGRSGPGPYGLYIVSVGYFAGGLPGALAGWLAMITPAFLIIPMLRYLGSRAEGPVIRSAIQGVLAAAAGLLLAATLPLARDALSGVLPVAIALASFVTLTATRVDVAWVLLGAAIAGLAAAAL